MDGLVIFTFPANMHYRETSAENFTNTEHVAIRIASRFQCHKFREKKPLRKGQRRKENQEYYKRFPFNEDEKAAGI